MESLDKSFFFSSTFVVAVVEVEEEEVEEKEEEVAGTVCGCDCQGRKTRKCVKRRSRVWLRVSNSTQDFSLPTDRPTDRRSARRRTLSSERSHLLTC